MVVKQKETSAQVANFKTDSVFNDESILLTMEAVVGNPVRKELTSKVYLLLDSGSQRSFMTERLAKTLEVPIITNEILILHTFVATDSIQYRAPKSEVEIQMRDGEKKRIRLNVIREMTTKLRTRVENNSRKTLSSRPVKSDILMG